MLGWLAPRYDVFISYKSQDVRLARAVADQLIAAGKRVWFAEYQILLRKYETFQEAIDEGIRRSEYGLAITNDRYADSIYCQREMGQLLERCGASRVLEVRVPAEPQPHILFPGLASSPAHAGDRVGDILSFVSGQTGWKIPPLNLDESAVPQSSVGAAAMDWRYRLDATGWGVRKPGSQSVKDWTWSAWRMANGENSLRQSIQIGLVPLSFDGPELERQGGGPPLFVNLHAGPEFSEHANQSLPDVDDREMYRTLMAYLPEHLGKLRSSKLRGLHLIFHGGRSQFAVTYRWGSYWTRKCSIILSHPASSLSTEFVFTFGLKGSFEDYCRHAHLMDDLVTSVEWGDEGRFVVFTFVKHERDIRDASTLRVVGVHSERDVAVNAAKNIHLGFACSEMAFIAEYGAVGEMKLAQIPK